MGAANAGSSPTWGRTEAATRCRRWLGKAYRSCKSRNPPHNIYMEGE